MKVVKILCDSCGMEITGNVFKVDVCECDRNDEGLAIGDEFTAELCETCVYDKLVSWKMLHASEEMLDIPKQEHITSSNPKTEIEEADEEAVVLTEFSIEDVLEPIEDIPEEDAPEENIPEKDASEDDMLQKITDEIFADPKDQEPKKKVKRFNTKKKAEADKSKGKYDIGKIMALKNAGWSHKQIAEEMHITEKAVGNQIYLERKRNKQ